MYLDKDNYHMFIRGVISQMSGDNKQYYKNAVIITCNNKYLPAGIVADIIGAQSTIGILSILLVISSVVVLITQKELRNVN